MVIFGDIHGRNFWKKALDKIKDNEEIIFLGDYLDPYVYEGITFDVAWDNFLEIIKFKEENCDRVILLLGNHDCHYLGYIHPCSRYNHTYAPRVKKLLEDKINLFQFTYEKKINDKIYLFSHAGILADWISQHQNILLSYDNISTTINNLFNEKNTKFFSSLSDVGNIRGGYCKCGSLVWADVSECKKSEDKQPDNIFQIFGHSQQDENPFITDRFACLDCRKPFRLNEDGELNSISIGASAKIQDMYQKYIEDLVKQKTTNKFRKGNTPSDEAHLKYLSIFNI